jgi:hypothetical protein
MPAGAGRAIASLVALQVLSKGVNFGLNVLVARASGVNLYALSSVPLVLTRAQSARGHIPCQTLFVIYR